MRPFRIIIVSLQVLNGFPALFKFDFKISVYQEIFDNHDTINEDTIVTVWKGWPGKDAWARKTAEITSEGLPAILSAPWYLNYVGYGSDWVKYYKVNPQAFTGGNKDLVYGGEVTYFVYTLILTLSISYAFRLACGANSSTRLI